MEFRLKNIRFCLSVFIVLAIFISGCLPQSLSSQATIKVTDDMDRVVELKSPAQKIISLAPSNTEILFAVGAGSQVIGRDSFSDYPEEAKQIPDVGGLTGSYNLEKITSMQPDLVILAGINSPELVSSLEKLKVNVFYLKNPTDIEGLYKNIETIGLLSGHEKDAAGLVKTLETKVDLIKTKMTGVTTHPKVYYELDGTDPTRPWTSGPGTYMDMMIKTVAGENIGAKLTTEWAQISQEEILLQNPDFILLGDGAYGITKEMVVSRPGWREINAVKNGHIELFDDNLVSRPGPRLVEGLEILAKIIHPEVMK
jgi:iron complex transport system substrate-binding protein